jgi:uroporphyrinogen decarboxylase
MDLCTNEGDVRKLLDALCEWDLAIIRQWGEAGADAVFMADDWGTQRGLMISPDMWRSIFKPYYRTMFAEVHRCGMDTILHSCGNIFEIIGDLIDIGLDVLDPIQPIAMDIDEVARHFGGHIAFCGTVDVQQLMVFGTPREVKDAIRRTIDVLGKPFGNALIVGPANMVPPDVPLANLRAMCEATHGV